MADSEPPLPLGWTAHLDPGGSGRYYYSSISTGQTTWERPAPPPVDLTANKGGPTLPTPVTTATLEVAPVAGSVAAAPAAAKPQVQPRLAQQPVAAAAAAAAAAHPATPVRPAGGGGGAAADAEPPLPQSVSAGSPHLGSAYDSIRDSLMQPSPTWKPCRTPLAEKPHGNCLCRISAQSIMLHDWKNCFWVMEEGVEEHGGGSVLHVFRDGTAFKAYHDNP